MLSKLVAWLISKFNRRNAILPTLYRLEIDNPPKQQSFPGAYPAVRIFSTLPLKISKSQFKISTAWQNWFLKLNTPKFNRYIKQGTSGFFATGWPRIQTEGFFRNPVIVLQFWGGWAQIEVIDYYKPIPHGMTNATNPELIHLFLCEKPNMTLVNGPGGVGWCPLIAKTPMWVEAKYLEVL